MAENSAIEWTDHTFNPWEGCQKVSPGCDHCYAEARNARYAAGPAPNWGPGAPRRRTSESNWRKPIKWNADAAAFAEKHGRKQRVFCASLADVFDNAVNPQWLADLFELIDRTPHLDWLLLTKRIGNVTPMLAGLGRKTLPVQAWLGATVVNQDEADRDIPKLLATPAAVRFLSCEPLLGPIAFKTFEWNGLADHIEAQIDHLDWVIAGGETGTGSRPMHPDWLESLHDECAAAGVPFFFKQWGDHQADRIERGDVRLIAHPPGHVIFTRVGKKVAGRKLYGVEHNGMPV